jgi:hypothetical protein
VLFVDLDRLHVRHLAEIEARELGRLTGLARKASEIAQLAVGDEIDRLLHAVVIRGRRRTNPAVRRTWPA